MKTLLIAIIVLIILPLSTHAQNSYSEAIQQGDAAYNRGQYKLAINKYFAAEAFDPAKDEVVKAKVNRVFDRIEQLRQEADEAKRQAQENLDKLTTEQEKTKTALAETEKAKAETQEALNKANKLIDAFYFYEDRFALAYKDRKFYYIDKNGDEVSKLGRWEKAVQFERMGFAKVKKQESGKLQNYLLDTFGNVYLVAYNLNEIDSMTRALDLSDHYWNTFPIEILKNTNLEILLLQGTSFRRNNFRIIPSEITLLENLKVLNLDFCTIEELPNDFGKLENLSCLYLNFNKISKLPNSIGSLQKLLTFELIQNDLFILPDSFVYLKNLRQLAIAGNNLYTLPDSIGILENLTVLDLSFNRLRQLPDSLAFLRKISFIDLRENELINLPKGLSNMKTLARLDLSGNRNLDLDSLFALLGRTEKKLQLETSILVKKNLEDGILRVNLNKMDKVPNSIGLLKQLTELDLSDCNLSSLPNSICSLNELKNVNLSKNSFTVFPSILFCLQQIIFLNLEHNKISSCPMSSGDLTKLKNLQLAGNQFTPEEKSKLEILLPNCKIEF